MSIRNKQDNKGVALIVVIMALAVITAFVVEFTYSVYVDMNFLQNWREGRKLATLATSGAALASGFIAENISRQDYTYPGSIVLPAQDPFDDGTGLSISVTDEDGKFNINSITYQKGTVDENRYEGFRRLLEHLQIDLSVADRVADWLDEDSVPMLIGSEDGVRNGHMVATDELLLIPGIDRKIYDKLEPYVTVFGSTQININAAEPPVLLTLSDEIDIGMAKRVVGYREISPFENVGQLQKVAGFENLVTKLTGKYSVKGTAFSIKTVASTQDGLMRNVTCVVDSSGLVKYWEEF